MRGRLHEGPFSLKETMKALGLPYSRPEKPLIQREKQIAALLKPLGRTGLYGEAQIGKKWNDNRRQNAKRQGQG